MFKTKTGQRKRKEKVLKKKLKIQKLSRGHNYTSYEDTKGDEKKNTYKEKIECEV